MEGLTQWLSQPYNSGQSAWGWFLFVGLILIALVLWGTILRDVRGVLD